MVLAAVRIRLEVAVVIIRSSRLRVGRCLATAPSTSALERANGMAARDTDMHKRDTGGLGCEVRHRLEPNLDLDLDLDWDLDLDLDLRRPG
jgi:hypothetical protein